MDHLFNLNVFNDALSNILIHLFNDGFFCNCNCGVPDPDCGAESFSLDCGVGELCVDGLCQSDVPPEWTCDPAFFNAGLACDCNCGVHDPDCDINSFSVDCGFEEMCVNGSCVEWSCPFSFYDDGQFCDCDCGVPDPDCDLPNSGDCDLDVELTASSIAGWVFVFAVIVGIVSCAVRSRNKREKQENENLDKTQIPQQTQQSQQPNEASD